MGNISLVSQESEQFPAERESRQGRGNGIIPMPGRKRRGCYRGESWPLGTPRSQSLNMGGQNGQPHPLSIQGPGMVTAAFTCRYRSGQKLSNQSGEQCVW